MASVFKLAKNYNIRSCEEECGYRYRLDVETNTGLGPVVLVVLLNPSRANSSKSDSTIGKVSNWAREKGFGKIIFINLFAFRSPHPVDLVDKTYDFLMGSRNDAETAKALNEADTIIVAWGRIDKAIEGN